MKIYELILIQDGVERSLGVLYKEKRKPLQRRPCRTTAVA